MNEFQQIEELILIERNKCKQKENILSELFTVGRNLQEYYKKYLEIKEEMSRKKIINEEIIEIFNHIEEIIK